MGTKSILLIMAMLVCGACSQRALQTSDVQNDHSINGDSRLRSVLKIIEDNPRQIKRGKIKYECRITGDSIGCFVSIDEITTQALLVKADNLIVDKKLKAQVMYATILDVMSHYPKTHAGKYYLAYKDILLQDGKPIVEAQLLLGTLAYLD